jgi:hypothetical protein
MTTEFLLLLPFSFTLFQETKMYMDHIAHLNHFGPYFKNVCSIKYGMHLVPFCILSLHLNTRITLRPEASLEVLIIFFFERDLALCMHEKKMNSLHRWVICTKFD